MFRKPIAVAALAAAVALTACTITVPDRPTTPAPVVVDSTPAPAVETSTPAAPPAATVPDYEAFLDAIAPGFVIYDLPRQNGGAQLREATIVAVDETCGVLGYAGGYEIALGIAEDSLGDRSTFTAAMPRLFVDAALAHVCPA